MKTKLFDRKQIILSKVYKKDTPLLLQNFSMIFTILYDVKSNVVYFYSSVFKLSFIYLQSLYT